MRIQNFGKSQATETWAVLFKRFNQVIVLFAVENGLAYMLSLCSSRWKIKRGRLVAATETPEIRDPNSSR
jgi:hypothetical protein